MPKVIIHVLNVRESLGLDGFQKYSKTDLFWPNRETNKILAKGKMDFDQALKGLDLGHIKSIFFTFGTPGRGYIKRQSKFQSKTLFSQNTFRFLVRLSPSKHPLIRWTCASYQATFRNLSFGGLVSHIKAPTENQSYKFLKTARNRNHPLWVTRIRKFPQPQQLRLNQSGPYSDQIWVTCITFKFRGGLWQKLLEWRSPTENSQEQPQITTIKKKPSHHRKREIKAQQTWFRRTE
ncbi:hypothetical protein YC2023_004637 [Brassica napus]